MRKSAKRALLKMPKTVKIGCINYTVKQVPDLKDDKGEDAYGFITPRKASIEVFYSKDLNETLAASVLLHECIHGVLHNYPVAEFSKEMEERLTMHLEAGLLALIRDNPKLMEYLQNA